MTIKYDWEITNLHVRNESPDHPDAVVMVQWKKIASDEDGNTAAFIGVTEFTAIDVLPKDFVSLNELNKDLVVSWIKSKITTKDIPGLVPGEKYELTSADDNINNFLQKQINLLKNPTMSKALPWV
jgi:hypothetical protein